MENRDFIILLHRAQNFQNLYVNVLFHLQPLDVKYEMINDKNIIKLRLYNTVNMADNKI